MPIFGTFRRRLSLAIFALLFGVGVAAEPSVNLCGAELRGESLLDGSLKSLFSPDAKQVKLSRGFDYTEDPSCTYCLFNVRIDDPKLAAQLIVDHFRLHANAPLLRNEIPLIIELAHQLNANLNIETHGDFLRFSLDMNGASTVRVTHLPEPERTVQYPSLDIDFYADQIRLVSGTMNGRVIGGRSVVNYKGGGHGHGLTIEKGADEKNLVIDTLDARAKYYVGQLAPSHTRLMLEVARRLAWSEGGDIQSVLFRAPYVLIPASRDHSF